MFKVCLKNEHSLECLPWRSDGLQSYRSCGDNLRYEFVTRFASSTQYIFCPFQIEAKIIISWTKYTLLYVYMYTISLGCKFNVTFEQ